MRNALRLSLPLMFIVACSSGGLVSRDIASEPALKLYSRSVKIQGYELDDARANDTLRKILEKSQEAHENDTYQEDKEATIYKTYAGVFEAAQADKKHPAHKLSSEEVTAIVNYSYQGFEDINGALWNGKWGDDPLFVEHQVLGLLSAVNKLAPMSLHVERGEFVRKNKDVNFEEAKKRFDSFVVGQHFEPKSFWSATRGESAEARGHFLNEALLLYKIEAKTARSVERFSFQWDEEEALFLPQTKFLVISKRQVPRQRTRSYPFDVQFEITLREVPYSN